MGCSMSRIKKSLCLILTFIYISIGYAAHCPDVTTANTIFSDAKRSSLWRCNPLQTCSPKPVEKERAFVGVEILKYTGHVLCLYGEDRLALLSTKNRAVKAIPINWDGSRCVGSIESCAFDFLYGIMP